VSGSALSAHVDGAPAVFNPQRVRQNPRICRKRGIEIIKTYADDGKSGLSIGGRAALQQMISDVESGAACFNAILIHDVSR
jgi:DNA invertase Pin-like site-specific DNA recombinase